MIFSNHSSLTILSFSLLCSTVSEGVKTGWGYVKTGVGYGLSTLSPSNIKAKYNMLRDMTWKEILVAFVKLNFSMFITILTLLFTIAW